MSNESTLDLISTNELIETYGFSGSQRAEMHKILADAGVPRQEIKYGKVPFILYNRTKATEVLDARKRAIDERMARARAGKAVKAAPAEAAAPSIDLGLIVNAVAELGQSLHKAEIARSDDQGELDAKVGTIGEGVAKLIEQNALIFKAINAHRADTLARIDALQSTLDNALRRYAPPEPAAPPAPRVKHDPQPTALEKPKRPRVAIIGLLAGQSNLIEREFHEVFDIRFFQSEDAKGRDFDSAITNCAAVFAMTNFINHGIDASIKAEGTRLIRVAGGLTSLRDKLTDLFANGATKPSEVQA